MAAISSLGIGSGLDANSIVSQLMAIEQQPITAVDKKISGVNAKISAFGSISSLLDTLKTASTTLSTPNKLSAFKGTSSNPDVLSATASSNAANSAYNINVQRLATAHKVGSQTALTGTATTALVGAGSFTVSLGTDDASTTDVNESSPITVTTTGSSSLGDLRDAINKATGSKVSASIVTTTNAGTSQSRLVLTAKDTGKEINISTDLSALGGFQTVGGPHTIANTTAFAGGQDTVGAGTLQFTVSGVATAAINIPANATLDTVAQSINSAAVGVTASVFTDTTGTHLKMVSTDPNKLISYTAIDDNMSDGADFSRLRGFSTVGSQPQIAQTALVDIEGQTIESASNAITSAISGVSINLTGTGSTTLNVARDQTAVSKAANDFVNAYNSLNAKLRTLTAYDATNKKGSTLTGDSTVRNIQSQLTSTLGSTPGTPSGTYSRLSDLGISIDRSGNLTLDSSKLQTAIEKDFDSVSNVLNRYGAEFASKVNDMTKSGGLITGKTDSLNSMISSYNDQKDRLQLRLTAIEARYRAQFTALDTMVASMQKTSTFLTKQLG